LAFEVTLANAAQETSSASACSELLVGEFAMRSRFHPLLSADDQAAISIWWRRMGGSVLMLVMAAVTWPLLNSNFDRGIAAKAAGRSADPTCANWDARASEAIVAFVQGSGHDIDLTYVGYMVGKMHKARRNCQLGFSNFACEEYRAVVRVAAAFIEPATSASIECGDAPTGDDLQGRSGISALR
jgi:hypothetical protein